MQAVSIVWTWCRQAVQQWGPYMLIELFLPGGSIIALGLFVYRTWLRPLTATQTEQTS